MNHSLKSSRSKSLSQFRFARSLKLEALENRELLCATTGEIPANGDAVAIASIVQSAQSNAAPISLATLDASVEKIESTVSPGSNKANIEWTRVEGATKYYLMTSTSVDGENYGAWTGLKYVDDPGDGSDTVSAKLTLTAGKYYMFKVRAITADGTTAYTETEDAIVVNKPESPEIISASVDRSTGIATVEFETVDNTSFYRFDYTFDEGATWQFSKYVYVGAGESTSSKIYIDTDATSAVVTHKLNANKTYQFRVRATNDCGSSDYIFSEPIACKGATAPETVNAQVTAGSHNAMITWSSSGDATQYFIESSTDGGESWSGVKKATAESFSYDESTDSYSYSYFISTGTSYLFRVRAYNALGTDGDGTVSNEVALLTPVTPENFTISSAAAVNPTNYPVGERYSKVSVTLSWAPADNATKYVVRYSKDGGSEKLLKNINDPSVTSVTFGAVAGSYYNFSITSVNSLGASESVETGVYGVYKTALNRVDVVEGEELIVTTVAPTGLTSVYQWQYRSAEGDWTDIAGATESSYTPSASDVANQYWIRVLVFGAEDACPGGSYVAEAVAGPVVESVKAPSDFTFGQYDADANALPMSWVDNSDNEAGFYVEYSTDDGTTWAKSAWLDANVTARTGAVYEGTFYHFRVRAYNASGYSAWTYSSQFPSEEKGSDVPSLCVTTNDDVVDSEDGLISLREAIAYASQYPNLGSEITFASSLNGKTIKLVDGALTVAQSLTFNGSDQNITVSGGGASRIFNITASGVTVEGLALTNGSSSQGGAVYLAEGSGAHFNACVFTSNTSSVFGGAVYLDDGSSGTFTNTAFSGNSAGDSKSSTGRGYGGAIYAYGETTTLTLEHVTIVNNQAVARQQRQCSGGGIYLSKSTANIYNSIIFKNTSSQGANVGAGNYATINAINVLTYDFTNEWSYSSGGAYVTKTNIVNMTSSTSLSNVLDPTTFQLVEGSAAIDAGDPELTPGVTTDLYGTARDSKPDLGACEYVASSSAVLDDVFAELNTDLEVDWEL